MVIVHRQELDGCSYVARAVCVELTTPLGHETFRRSTTFLRERLCVSVSIKISLSFLSFFELVFYAYLR